MAEVLVRFTERIVSDDGVLYQAQACGAPASDGLWEGWIEFVSPTGKAFRSPRETGQPNRDTLMYWAQGLSDTYLQGALSRAVTPRAATVPRPADRTDSIFDGPATGRPTVKPVASPVLDPFATYAQGEGVLRRQLSALSRDHVVTIAKAYRLDLPLPAEKLSDSGLIDAIVATIRRQSSAVTQPIRNVESRAEPDR